MKVCMYISVCYSSVLTVQYIRIKYIASTYILDTQYIRTYMHVCTYIRMYVCTVHCKHIL